MSVFEILIGIAMVIALSFGTILLCLTSLGSNEKIRSRWFK